MVIVRSSSFAQPGEAYHTQYADNISDLNRKPNEHITPHRHGIDPKCCRGAVEGSALYV
jgi:hypothetical protein